MKSREENYLDNLLNSISGKAPAPEEEIKETKRASEPDTAVAGDAFSDMDEPQEDDFLKQFEAELDSDEDSEFLKEFEMELEAETNQDLDPYPETSDPKKNASDLVSAVLKQMDQAESEPVLVNTVNKGTLQPDKAPLNEPSQAGNSQIEESTEEEPLMVNTMDDDPSDDDSLMVNTMGDEDPFGPEDPENSLEEIEVDTMESSQEEHRSGAIPQDELMDRGLEESDLGETFGQMDALDIPMDEETGEPILAGDSDSDLLDLLSSAGELSDIGDLLSGEGAVEEVADEFDAFAKQEMESQQEAQPEAAAEGAGDKKGKKKKEKKPKEKKPRDPNSFLAKLSRIFFGEDEDEDEGKVILVDDQPVDASELSDENLQILQELEQADNGGNGGKAKKEKKQKEKKEKKPKEPKPKKEKKPKVPKVKKPKEVDNTPPLPKAPVILILVMVASLMALVLLGTTLFHYSSSMSAAKSYYARGQYSSAIAELKGLSIRESDEEFYTQAEILATVSGEYDSYEVFQSYGQYDLALDSLICAEGRYNLNREDAETYACSIELDALEQLVSSALQEQYQMTAEEALEMYQLKDREDYTKQLYAKIAELGLE